MDMEGNWQMNMDNDDKHETETDRVGMTNGHENGDSTTSGSKCRARRKSHAVMPPLVSDSEDGKIVIKPIGDM
jgi:hypothetical protein